MKFFLDVNIPHSALKLFRELGWDAVHARDVKLSNADDFEIFEYSVKNKRILITKDLGFGNPKIFPIKSYHGLVILRLPFFFNAFQQVRVLKTFLISNDVKDLKESITIVKLDRYRIRKIK